MASQKPENWIAFFSKIQNFDLSPGASGRSFLITALAVIKMQMHAVACKIFSSFLADDSANVHRFRRIEFPAFPLS